MWSEQVRKPVWLVAESRRHWETEQDRARGSDFQALRGAAAETLGWEKTMAQTDEEHS